jgi:hypothetical protein
LCADIIIYIIAMISEPQYYEAKVFLKALGDAYSTL